MGLEEPKERTRYDMSDLGYLDDSRDVSLQSMLRLSASSLVAPMAFIGFADDRSTLLVPKAVHGTQPPLSLPLHETLAGAIRDQQKVLSIPDMPCDQGLPSADIEALRAKSAVGAPIFGPAGEPVGAFVVADHMPRHWTVAEERALRDTASLIGQQILLKAALMTLKLMVKRGPTASVHDFRN